MGKEGRKNQVNICTCIWPLAGAPPVLLSYFIIPLFTLSTLPFWLEWAFRSEKKTAGAFQPELWSLSKNTSRTKTNYRLGKVAVFISFFVPLLFPPSLPTYALICFYFWRLKNRLQKNLIYCIMQVPKTNDYRFFDLYI